MERARTVLGRAVTVLVAVVVVGGALLWALPEITRRVVLDQVPRRTGRAVDVEDVDLNVFTGRVSLKKVRLAERHGAQAFVELDRLDARLAPTALWRSDIHLTELALVAPAVRVVRTGPGEFNFSDLLPRAAASPPGEPEAAPSRWTVTVGQLTISGGAVRVRDEAVAPPTEWQVRDLQVEAGDLTTRPGAPPGRGSGRARVDEAALDVTAGALRLRPLAAVVEVALDGFELRRLGPYLAQANTPYRLKGGRLGAALTATVDHRGDELTRASVSGTVTVEREDLARTERHDPFLSLARVDVEVKEADAVARSLTIKSAAIESAALRARRDAGGVIDLVEMLRASAPPAAAPGAAAPPSPPALRRLAPVLRALAGGFEQILVERVTLGPSTVTLVDEAVTPPTTLALTGMRATVTDLSWPPEGPATLALSTGLPGGGTLHVKGPVVPQPFDADLAFHVRNAPVEPYQAYIPVPGRLRGRFGGDSRNRIALKDGTMLLASTGNGWGEGVEIRAPGASHPAIRVERMDLVGIELDWPTRARVATARFRHPGVEVVREADGSFDVARLFTAPGAAREADTSPQPAALPRGEEPKGLLATMRLDVGQVRVEDGVARFLDRTTTPAFSKDLSQLVAAVDGLGNRPGGRARVAVQSVVSGESALDIRGEIGALGSPAFADLVGALGGVQLASFNPYAEAALGWVVTRGELQHTARLVLDGDALEAANEVVVDHLQVARAPDSAGGARYSGVPLGLIVALAKDAKGEIRVSVPVTGSIKDPKFDLREAVRTATRKVVANIVRAPFRAIGARPPAGDEIEEPTVAPVTFAAGSAVIAPDMEQHLLRVADFLRRSPFVNLALATVPGAADVAALGVARGPAPGALLGDLARRRAGAVRERLVSVEGIPADRLEIGEPRPDAAPPGADSAGRVEFTVVAGRE
jgi:outer membrane protein OmpA-like peptidoglycan-associated protein